MNGDPNKPEIAKAQAYFADQTYKQEQQESLTEEQRRAVLRDRVKDANKKLGGAAKDAGEVGKEVRKTIEIIGGTMPEHLPAAPSIKRIKPARRRRRSMKVDKCKAKCKILYCVQDDDSNMQQQRQKQRQIRRF